MDVGSWALLVVTCALVVALLAGVAISVAAFAQGRDLSLWPPKIGQRPPDTDPRRDNRPMTMGQARAHGFQTDDIVAIANNKNDYSFLGVFRP
jgi:hypothetical protein